MPIRPVDLKKIEASASNIYEGVIVASKRARSINDEVKLEFTSLVATVAPASDDEFEDRINPEQMKISLEFEKRQKPHLKSLNELLENKIEYRFKDEE
jgi:DNA-directed RNA polymerase subunit K/omega